MATGPVKILLVEDSPSDAELLQETLTATGGGEFDFARAERLEEALGLLRQGAFDVVLLDLGLPDSTGPATYLRARAAAPQVPIVVLTGAGDEVAGLEAVRYGVQDYLVKGQADGRLLARAIRYAIGRQQLEEMLKRFSIESAQRASELRAIFDALQEPVLVFDAAGKAVETNAAAVAAFGLDPTQLDAEGYAQLSRQVSARRLDGRPIPPEELPSRRALRGETVRGEPCLLTNPQGRIVALEIFATPLLLADGKVMGAVAVWHDITERRRMEDALRRSEERFRLAAEAARGMVYELEVEEGRFLAAHGLPELLGYQPGEVPLSREWWNSQMHPEDLPAAERQAQELLAGAAGYTLQYRIRHKQGHYVSVSDTARIVRNEAGRPVRIVGGVVDITAREQAEEALRGARDYAENLIHTATVMIIGLDTAGNVQVFNEAAEKLTGYTQLELAGRNWFEVLVPKDRYREVWAEFGRLREGGLPGMFENPILTKAGEERLISWRNNHLREHGRVVGTISFGIDITERKRAELALRESQRHLLLATEGAELGTWDWDLLNGRQVWDARCKVMLGLPPDSQLSHDIVLSTVHPADRSRVGQAVRLALAEGRDYDLEYRVPWPDGSVRWIHAKGGVTSDEGGKPVRLSGVLIDVTRSKRAEEALRESEERLRLAIGAANEAIWDWSLIDGLMAWNETYAREFGRPPETAHSTQWWYDHIHPDDRVRVAASLRAALDGRGDIWSEEYRCRRADGTWAHIYDRAVIARAGSGEPRRVVGAMLDLTERKRAEAALRESEERYRQLVELSVDAIVVHQHGRYVYANAAALKLFGATTTEQIIGRNVADLLAVESKQSVAEQAGRILQTGQPSPLEELILLRVDGQTVDVEARGNLILYQGQPAIQAVLRDITERKRAQEALQKAHADLEQKVAERTAELRRVNEMLRMISDCNQALVQMTDEQELVQTICRIIHDAGGYHVAWVGLAEHDEARTVRPVAAAGCDPDAFERAQFTWADHGWGLGPTGTAIRTGQIRRVHDFQTETDLAPWREEALRGGYRSAIALPLTATGGMLGALTLCAAAPGAFDESQVSLFKELADDLAFGIVALRARNERDQAQRSLELKTAQLRQLALELTRAEERERHRVAQILHGHLQQLLVGARYSLESLRDWSKARPFQEAVKRTDAFLGECLEAAHSLTHELSPPILYESGLTAALQWLGRWCHDRLGLSVEVQTDEPVEVEVEEIRIALFQAVRELLLNVVKHAQVKQAQIHVSRTPDQQVQIVVSDAGAGFDPSQIRARGGPAGGFGLFSLRERLEGLGGRLEIQSAPGRGSRLTLWAPLQAPAPAVVATPAPATPAPVAPAPAPPPRERPPRRPRRIRVLLADDHAVLRDGLRHVLESEADIEVVGEATDGPAAVELAQQLQPDIVIMDVSMPRLNGIEATRQICAALPHARVIGLSMFEERGAEMRAAGAVAYLSKNGPVRKVVGAVRAWAGRQRKKPPSRPAT